MEEAVISGVHDFARSMNSGSKVVSDMSALVNATSALPLTKLDYWERLIRNEFYKALEATAQPKWKIWNKPQHFLTWVDLCSWDGFKREKTIRTLSNGAPNTFFFALVLRRLNDWVPQVRKAVREHLPKIAELSNPEHVADGLCLILSNWNSWGRIEDEDKKVLLKIISSKPVAAALKIKILNGTSGPLPTIFSQIGREATFDSELHDFAVNAVQPSVRAKAFRCLFEGEMTWVEGYKWKWTDVRFCKGRVMPIIGKRKLTSELQFLKSLHQASGDRSSLVRRVAAEILIRELDSLGSEAKTLANKFSKDSALSVSERGDFALKKLELQSIEQ